MVKHPRRDAYRRIQSQFEQWRARLLPSLARRLSREVESDGFTRLGGEFKDPVPEKGLEERIATFKELVNEAGRRTAALTARIAEDNAELAARRSETQNAREEMRSLDSDLSSMKAKLWEEERRQRAQFLDEKRRIDREAEMIEDAQKRDREAPTAAFTGTPDDG
jgi:hypothetical protein